MFGEFEDKKIFKIAESYAIDYIEKAFDRNVFPSDEAIKNLEKFEEDLDENPCDYQTILQKLHQFGSPSTMAS